MVSSNVELALVRDVHAYRLIVYWSSSRVGYALFCGHPSQRLLIGVNSYKLVDDSSSFLGELRSIAWALQYVKTLVQGRPLVIWTNAESV